MGLCGVGLEVTGWEEHEVLCGAEAGGEDVAIS